MRTPVTYNDQPNNDVTISPDHNHQQYQQYVTSNNIPHHNYQQSIVSNNIPNHNYQQSMSNNVSLPQFYPQYINQNPLNPSQSNIFPLLNSLGININSPQTTIIIMPTTNSDIQNQLQQIHTYLNYSSSTNNSQTRPQQ